MTEAALDRLLALLLVGIGATGLLSLTSGAPSAAWVFVAHDVLAVTLAAASVVKVARAVPGAVRARRRARLAIGLVVAAATLAPVGLAIAWVGSGRILTLGTVTAMTVHAWFGLVLVPLMAVHLVPRRWRLLRPRALRAATRGGLSRRTLLRAASFGAVAVVGVVGANAADRVLGGTRRFTGSRPLPVAGIPPSTTFIADAEPSFAVSPWRLAVSAGAHRMSFDAEAFDRLPLTDTIAVLDCTSGWSIETAWTGVRLSDVLTAAGVGNGAARVTVRSATGWAAAFDVSEAERLVLATHVAGVPFPAANGAPCRLVAPDHRGHEWVKWVTELEVA